MIKCYKTSSMYLPQHNICFDNTDDLEELTRYAAEEKLMMGSVAVCCADGSEYILDSTGKWNKKGGNT